MAFLARLNPLGAIAAGLVVALAELGGDAAQISMNISKVVTGIFKGILLFVLLAGETLTRYRLVWRGAKSGREMFDAHLLIGYGAGVSLIIRENERWIVAVLRFLVLMAIW